MYRKATLSLLLIVALCSSISSATGLVAGGFTNVTGSLKPYIYGELALTDDVRVGVDYNEQMLTMSLWSGTRYGFYAEGSWRLSKGGYRATEFGAWTYLQQDGQLDVKAWAGAKALYGEPGVLLTLNAQAEVPLFQHVGMVAGVGTTLLDKDGKVDAWIGAVTRF